MTYDSFELKYCERCGGLGLRRSKSGLPYCSECEQIMRYFVLEPNSKCAIPGRLRRIVFRRPERVLSQPQPTITTPEAVYAS